MCFILINELSTFQTKANQRQSLAYGVHPSLVGTSNETQSRAVTEPSFLLDQLRNNQKVISITETLGRSDLSTASTRENCGAHVDYSLFKHKHTKHLPKTLLDQT